MKVRIDWKGMKQADVTVQMMHAESLLCRLKYRRCNPSKTLDSRINRVTAMLAAIKLGNP
jgi:hypothetical protein